MRLVGPMTMLRVLTPQAVADLLGESDSEGATEFWIWEGEDEATEFWIREGEDEATYGVGYSRFVFDQIENLLEESEVETLVDTPEA